MKRVLVLLMPPAWAYLIIAFLVLDFGWALEQGNWYGRFLLAAIATWWWLACYLWVREAASVRGE